MTIIVNTVDTKSRLATSDGGLAGPLNPIAVRENSFVDADNSTTSTLIADAVFTGEWIDVLQYSVIIVSVFSNVASATDGLCIDWSSDGITKRGSDVFTIPASVDKTFSFQPVRRYFRVVYTNGGTVQTTFDLQVQLKSDYVKPSSHRIKDSIISDDDAELSKSVLTGEDPDGTFQNVQTTRDGNLTISDNSNGLAIAEGNVTGKTFIHKFGNAPAFDTGDNEVTVWDGANDSLFSGSPPMTYTFSSSADINKISSSNNSDTVDIEIQGLDTDYNIVTQTITLTGQTDVTLSTSLIRVFRMKNVGSTDLAGYAYLRAGGTQTLGVPDAANTVRSIINNGNNQTEMAIYTIPAGKTGYLRSFYSSSAGANKSSNYIMKIKARPFGQVFQLKHKMAIGDLTPYRHEYIEPEVFTEKTDIIMTTQAAAAGVTDASISAGFDIVLVDN